MFVNVFSKIFLESAAYFKCNFIFLLSCRAHMVRKMNFRIDKYCLHSLFTALRKLLERFIRNVRSVLSFNRFLLAKFMPGKTPSKSVCSFLKVLAKVKRVRNKIRRYP